MFISRPDAQLFAVAFGNGPGILVALGGWVGSWELWVEPFALLSPTWRTIAYDHRGTGATVAPPESITLPSMVEELFAVLDAFTVAQCVLAAESSGAVVALQAALQQPARFSGLVVVDGLYHRERPSGADPFVHALQTDFQATLGKFVDACVPEPEPNSAAIRRWGRQIVGRSSPRAAIQLYECLYGVDLRPQVSQIAQPSLIVHGDADAFVPISEAEWLAAQIHDSQLIILPGAGRVPTVTLPQAVDSAIDQFFAAHYLA